MFQLTDALNHPTVILNSCCLQCLLGQA